jgi:putative Mn2+ efflux pump MntP
VLSKHDAVGLLRVRTALVLVLIALQTLIVTQLGLRLGNRFGARILEGAERLAGVALTGLGVALLAEKLLA